MAVTLYFDLLRLFSVVQQTVTTVATTFCLIVNLQAIGSDPICIVCDSDFIVSFRSILITLKLPVATVVLLQLSSITNEKLEW